MNRYIVWVAGIEANPYPVTQLEAEKLADIFLAEGYTDVIIEKA